MLKGQVQETHEDDNNSKWHMASSIEEYEKTIVGLKSEIEEAKKFEEDLTSQLQEKKGIFQN